MQLKPFQREAVDAIEREFERVRGTVAVMATGTGKTPTFGEVARRFVARGKRVLVLAHRSELLDQAAATLRRFGLSVEIEQGERRVDPAALPDVVVASVQTLRGERLAAFAADAFGLIVIDEAHHAPAPSYGAPIDHFAAAKLLGVTATPDRADGVGLRNRFDSVAYRLEIGAAIKAGHLAPIELRTVVVDDLDLSRVRVVAGDLHAGELEAELTRDRVLHEVAGPLAELSAGRQTLAFVAGVAQAHALAEVLRGYGVKAAAVDGAMSLEQRAAVLDDYRSGRVQMVTNAMLWVEGFDCPATSVVALVRPTRSRSLLVQQIGRGTRLAEGKRSCLVLDFVPGRVGSMRLAGPADALAGEDLPDAIAGRVRNASAQQAGELLGLIASAESAAAEEALAAERAKQQAAEERARQIRSVGVIYSAPIINVDQLLEAVCEPEGPEWRPEWQRRPASPAQRGALERAGFVLPANLTNKQAKALFRVLEARRAAGLCSLRQASKLASFGLRDDMTFDDASKALDAIARNGWRPPANMFDDPRFARPRTAHGNDTYRSPTNRSRRRRIVPPVFVFDESNTQER